jgi:hypothetical protein
MPGATLIVCLKRTRQHFSISIGSSQNKPPTRRHRLPRSTRYARHRGCLRSIAQTIQTRIRELNSELAQSLLKYFRESELADNYLVRGFKISTDLDGKWSKQFPIYEVASETMRFSWTGLMLAPLLVPLMFCAVVSPLLTNGWVPLAFLVLLVPSCVVSYGTTIFLFLPSLFLLSLWRPMTGLKVCLLGLVLGAVVFVPLTLLEWKSSGPDSGPPTESFWVFFLRWAADPMTAIDPAAGLVTAGLYWWLARFSHITE